jgi:hypothetical protein
LKTVMHGGRPFLQFRDGLVAVDRLVTLNRSEESGRVSVVLEGGLSGRPPRRRPRRHLRGQRRQPVRR